MAPFVKPLLGLALLLGALTAAGQSPKAAAPTGLKAGKAVLQTMKAGETHEYAVNLKAGEALKATAVQQGVDVLVTAYGPDGAKLAEFDSPTSTEYMEFVTVAATQPGRYRLVVTPFDPKATPGKYELKLTGILSPAEYAQSQADDQKRADAVAAYLQTPHPDLTYDEQRTQMLKLNPAALMGSSGMAAVEACRWLEGSWTATTKRFATAGMGEITFPARTSTLRFDPKKPTVLTASSGEKENFQPLMSYEPLSRQWVQASVEVEGSGMTSWELLKGHDWQNNQLVMEGESGFLGMTAHERRTLTRTDDRTMRTLVEHRKADGSWQPVAETIFTRSSPAVITAK